MVFILVMVSPAMTRVAPTPEHVTAKMLEYTEEHNAFQNPPFRVEPISPQIFEDFIAADLKIRSVFPMVLSGYSGEILKQPDHEDIIKLSTPLQHILSSICLTFMLPLIFRVLYYLASTFTLCLKKGFSTLKFMYSFLKQGSKMPKQVTEEKDLEQECILMKAFSLTDTGELKESNQNFQPESKHHENQCFESEVYYSHPRNKMKRKKRKNNNPA
jgi:hypothetical protein